MDYTILQRTPKNMLLMMAICSISVLLNMVLLVLTISNSNTIPGCNKRLDTMADATVGALGELKNMVGNINERVILLNEVDKNQDEMIKILNGRIITLESK